MYKFKVLYKKMVDDLKDSDMWLDWAKKLETKDPMLAKFFTESAEERLEVCFPKTLKIFYSVCEESKNDEGKCAKELVEEDLEDWHECLMHKLKHM